MTTWFGARKSFAWKKRCARRKEGFFDLPWSANVKDMNNYMRRRGLTHSFVEKTALRHFVASIYGKVDEKVRALAIESGGDVWFADDDPLRYRPLPPFHSRS